MTRAEVVQSISERLLAALIRLETTGTPGSIAVVVHCDSGGAKKVQFTVEESYRLDKNASQTP